jgi:hypothetical protein
LLDKPTQVGIDMDKKKDSIFDIESIFSAVVKSKAVIKRVGSLNQDRNAFLE